MGLDVYLYQCDDFDAAGKAEDAYEAALTALYANASLSDTARRAEIEKVEVALGVRDGRHESRRSVRTDSALHPGHLFKVGYFRSSYNESGINRILPGGLDGIFGVTRDSPYFVSPDWRRSRGRAALALQHLENLRADPDGRLRATFQRATPYRADSITRTAEQAVDAARAAMVRERARPKDDAFGGSYSSAAGLFTPDKPMEVVAVLVGTGIINDPGVWLVYRAAEDWLDWYVQAVEIVIETIDFVLEHTAHRGTDREGAEFRLGWSS